MKWAAFFLVGLGASALIAQQADIDSVRRQARGVTPEESALVEDYSKTLSKEWLKKFFHVDVDVFDLALQQFKFGVVGLGVVQPELEFVAQPQGAQTALDEVGRRPKGADRFSLRLEQVGDIRQLAYDSRDVPFALKMDADRFFGGEGMKLQASLSLPLSWRGELSARASLPLPALDTSGFGSNWRLSSIYSNRLGVSSVDTGLGTRWMGDWDLGFDSRIRFGQGVNETSQWLKLGRTF